MISLLILLSIFLIFCRSPNVICCPSGEFFSHWPTLLLTFPIQSWNKIHYLRIIHADLRAVKVNIACGCHPDIKLQVGNHWTNHVVGQRRLLDGVSNGKVENITQRLFGFGSGFENFLGKNVKLSTLVNFYLRFSFLHSLRLERCFY